MKCFAFHSRHDLSQNVFMRYERIVPRTLSPPIGVKERLVDNDGVRELCISYPITRERLIRKEWCWKAFICTRSTIYVERLNVFSWFTCAFQWRHTVHQFSYINTQLTCLMNFCFLWVILEKSACPNHTLWHLWSFWSTDKFLQILPGGSHWEKLNILTIFLVKQTEFALVEFWPSVAFVRTSRCSVRTVTPRASIP